MEIALDDDLELYMQAVLEADRSITIADLTRDDVPLIAVNPAFERVTGYSPAEVIGRNCRFLQGPGTDRKSVEIINKAIAARVPVTITLLNYRKDGSTFWNELSMSPLRDRNGGITHYVGVQSDVTARVEAQKRAEELYASEHAAHVAAQDLNARLEAILGTMPSGVVVAEAPSGRLINVNPEVAQIWRMEFPETSSIAEYCNFIGFHDDGRRYEPHEWPLSRAILTGQKVADEEIEIERGDGTHAFISLRAAPIRDGSGDTVAAVVLFEDITDRRAWERRLTEEKERTLALATTLQLSLLPAALPENAEGIEFGAAYSPVGEGLYVGGDFYDVFEQSPGSWVLAIGDVMGKGVGAATVTSLARHSLRTVSLRETSPAAIFGVLNQALLRDDDTDRFCTIAGAVATVTPTGADLVLGLGGHPMPMIIRATGEVESVGMHGTLLGAYKDVHITDVELKLAAGESIVFFTDGVTEAVVDGELLGEEGLRTILRGIAGDNLSASEIARYVQTTVMATSDGEAKDDLAVLVAKVSS